MKYQLSLSFDTNIPDKIYQILEQDSGKKDRSNTNIKKEKKSIKITISAKDAIALKSATNLTLQNLSIIEKTQRLK